jgi:hypothetical protein
MIKIHSHEIEEKEVKTLAKSFIGILCVLAFAASSAGALTVDFIVPSEAMPWYSNSGLNAGKPYGYQDGIAPIIVDSRSGFFFTPGIP